MTPDEAMALAGDITPEYAVGNVTSLGPERMAALVLAMDAALRGGCPCECCVSLRAVYQGVA